MSFYLLQVEVEDVTGRQLEAAERTEDALAVYWCKYHGVTEGRKKGRKEDSKVSQSTSVTITALPYALYVVPCITAL